MAFWALRRVSVVIVTIIAEINKAEYFSIILNESSDIARLEQASILFRFIGSKFNVSEELFVVFYETKSTTSDILYKIVCDVFIRFGLNIWKLRGQCYGRASNVRYGLKKLVCKDESRALYIHCIIQQLNLDVIRGQWYIDLSDISIYFSLYIGLNKFKFFHFFPEKKVIKSAPNKKIFNFHFSPFYF